MGKVSDSTAVTIRHGGARFAAELRRGHSYDGLGKGKSFALNHLHGEVRGLKAKLDG